MHCFSGAGKKLKRGEYMSDFAELAERDPGAKYLEKQKTLGEKLIFITYDGRTEGVIEEILKYDLKLEGHDESLKKHDILFLYKPDVSEAVRRILKTDREVAGKGLKAELKRKKRLNIPAKILHNCLKDKRKTEVTLRNGDVLRGRIFSFGIFSIRLEIEKNRRVIIMRPNIHDLNHSPEEKPAEVCRGNVKTGIFHSAGCRYSACDDCTAVFSSQDEAVKAGFRPHGQCVK